MTGSPAQRGEGALVRRACVLRAAHRDVEIAQEAVADAVDPAVDGQFLAAFPGVARDRGLADVGDLFDDVELAQASTALVSCVSAWSDARCFSRTSSTCRSQLSLRPSRSRLSAARTPLHP